jgi:hypothetical protein
MSNAIQFLATLGINPLTATEYAATVSMLNVNEAQRTALLDRDEVALNTLLDGRTRLYCAVCAPDEREEPSPDEGEVPEKENPVPSPD